MRPGHRAEGASLGHTWEQRLSCPNLKHDRRGWGGSAAGPRLPASLALPPPRPSPDLGAAGALQPGRSVEPPAPSREAAAGGRRPEDVRSRLPGPWENPAVPSWELSRTRARLCLGHRWHRLRPRECPRPLPGSGPATSPRAGLRDATERRKETLFFFSRKAPVPSPRDPARLSCWWFRECSVRI